MKEVTRKHLFVQPIFFHLLKNVYEAHTGSSAKALKTVRLFSSLEELTLCFKRQKIKLTVTIQGCRCFQEYKQREQRRERWYDLLGGLNFLKNSLSGDSSVVLKVRKVIFQGFSKFTVSEILNFEN